MSKRLWFAALLVASFVLSTHAAGPTFRPDVVFKGSALTGWAPLGDASWRAQNGEIIGTAKSPGGGWLVLDKSYQDVALFTNLQCASPCKAGVLLRAEKTANGMKGILVSLTEGDLASYAVEIDAQGRETKRERLQAGGGGGGGGRGGAAAGGGAGGGRGGAAAGGGAGGGRAGAPAAAPGGAPAGAPPAGAGRAGGQAGATGPAPSAAMPADLAAQFPNLAARPTGTYRAGQVNAVDITLAKASVALKLNGAPFAAGSGGTTPEIGNYGPIALYVGGTGEARFKDVAYADLNQRPFAAEKTSANFRGQRINEFYYSYTAAIGDVNRDGNQDIIAGPYYYLGPTFEVGRELAVSESYNPTSQYPLPWMVNIAHDFTGDGWVDVISMGGNAGNGTGTLYVNPKGENRRWDSHVVVQPVGNEDTILKDINGDGKPELIHSGGNTLQYSTWDPANPTARWTTTTISQPGPWGANIGHGMGIGDINGDGLVDYVNTYGWWEQPKPGSGQTLWTHHPAELARWGASQGGAGGAEFGVYDINGDKLTDVVSPLEGHGFGIAWHEQKRDASGKISFVRHMVMDGFLDTNAGGVTFTQPHAATYADINQDGILDLITGKRHHSHFQYQDPDNWGSPVLYVYKVLRNPKAPGGAEFVPELVHNKSGVGSRVAVGDLNKDGTVDIATSGPSGTFVFFNLTKKGAR